MILICWLTTFLASSRRPAPRQAWGLVVTAALHFAAAASLAFSLELPSSSAKSDPLAPGFNVVGATIIDPKGQPFVAHGVNVSGLNWVWPRKTAEDVGKIVDCWRFNLVRVNSFLFPESKWPQVNDNNDLDRIINLFTSRGIVVVLEAHDRTGSFYQGEDLERLALWYADLARRYRDNPYVWFDVMNEPGKAGPPDRENWTQVHRRVISAIRDESANNVILVEGTSWAQDAGVWDQALVAPSDSAILSFARDVIEFGGKTYSNIAFSIHVYDMWNYPSTKLADYIDRVRAHNLALIIGEYGSEIDEKEKSMEATVSMFAAAVPRRIGRVVWHWDERAINRLTIGGGGWKIDSCSKPHNLTPLGKLVWSDNHAPQRERQ